MSPPPKPPVWLDTNILVHIDNGTMPQAEAEIINLQRGHEVLLVPSVEREFLHGQRFNPADTVRRQGILTRLQLQVDTMANQVPMQQLRAWREEAMHHGLSIDDADIIAQVRASAQARGIRNPVFLTRDAGGTLIRMRQRGVLALEFRAPPIRTQIPVTPTPKPVPKPEGGSLGEHFSAAKAGFKAGLKSAFSVENIAAAIPDAILALADRVAAREAIRTIETKFLKEGFAKGVAAGVMGWTEQEVGSNLKNHVTHFRVKGLEDPAGILRLGYILKLAEAYENYAVDIGYLFSSSKTLEWKKDMRSKGFPVLKEYGYHFGTDPEVLFEYDFIDKLAWVLHPATDSIVEPMIRFR